MNRVSREAAQAALLPYYSSVISTVVNTMEDLEALVQRKPDLVFLGAKYFFTEQNTKTSDPNLTWIAEYLDEHSILYTGSNKLAHTLELHKHLAKQRVANVGLSTSPYYVVPCGERPDMERADLGYPLFVKPTNRGGGIGIDAASLVNSSQELEAKVAAISTKIRTDSLVEKYLSGREFSVAILKDEFSSKYHIMPVELSVSPEHKGSPVLSADIKSANIEIVSIVHDEDVKATVSELAINVFHVLGARDYGRIDIRMDKFGVPHFLEANLLPSLIEDYGSFPKACVLHRHMEHGDMILAIVQLAFKREYDVLEETNNSPIIPVLAAL